MEEQDYSESTNTEKQNSQNVPDYKRAEVTSNGRLKGFLVSENVVNLSNRKLSKAEVSLLSKCLRFCPTPNSVDKSVLKEELEKFGRALRLKWHIEMMNGLLILIRFGLNLNLILAKLMQPLNYILAILKRNFFLALKLNILLTI